VRSLRAWGTVTGIAEAAERDPRANQKNRTRQAIIDAALGFIEEGVMPSVVEAAERAKVSRATAYRYFPTQPDLAGTLEAERWMRAIHRTMLDAWLKSNQEGGAKTHVRVPTRLGWVEGVLGPAADLDDRSRRRLAAALTLVLGIEPIAILKDVNGLDDEETLDVLTWAADVLLRGGLQGFREIAGAGFEPATFGL
jgi:AcrR family transcriptional regulator